MSTSKQIGDPAFPGRLIKQHNNGSLHEQRDFNESEHYAWPDPVTCQYRLRSHLSRVTLGLQGVRGVAVLSALAKPVDVDFAMMKTKAKNSRLCVPGFRTQNLIRFRLILGILRRLSRGFASMDQGFSPWLQRYLSSD